MKWHVKAITKNYLATSTAIIGLKEPGEVNYI